MSSARDLLDALDGVMEPESGHSILSQGMVRSLRLEGGKASFALALPAQSERWRQQVAAAATTTLLGLQGLREVEIEAAEMTAQEQATLQQGGQLPGLAQALNRVNRVIAVLSGKGGVGKSVVAALLAVSLRRAGHQVGILDADITGPSIPRLFFRQTVRPEANPVAMIPAVSASGVRVMSINLLLDQEDAAVIWRGEIVSRVIRQFWQDVLWDELDYLVVDLPPGTSDASLTVLESLPVTGVVLVTSPQSLAGMVVRKAAQMVTEVKVPMLGLLENMSYYLCPETGVRHEIFGPSQSEAMAQQMGLNFLGRIPIDPEIAALCDSGRIEEYSGEAFAPVAVQIAALVDAGPAPAGTVAGKPQRSRQSVQRARRPGRKA